MKYSCEIQDPLFMALVVRIGPIEVRDSGQALKDQLENIYTILSEVNAEGTDNRRKAVRNLLRNGKFKPAGRSKPSQEYLLKLWEKQGSIDIINNAVDVNNIVSLHHGLPISAFDVGKIRGDIVIRLGKEDENYVFNASGQELKCHDLVVVCDDRGPIGSPVKDSQATKLFPGAQEILYIVYASKADMNPEELKDIAQEFGQVMTLDCPEAKVIESELIVGTPG